MKNIFKILAILLFTFSCKAQSIYPLEGPYGNNNDPMPYYIKDLNNIRDNFIGIWQGIDGTNELTIYLYKIDNVPHGLLGSQDLQFQDAIFGYYIYKENGIELINGRTNAQEYNNSDLRDSTLTPIFGFTYDGVEINNADFIDYGKLNQRVDGTFGVTGGYAAFKITNVGNATLESSFELTNRPESGRRFFDGDSLNIIIQPYDYTFSIPTSFTLTKIANVPPPL